MLDTKPLIQRSEVHEGIAEILSAFRLSLSEQRISR